MDTLGILIATLIKPFVLLALLLLAAVSARLILNALPEGRLKRLLGFRWEP